MKPTFLIIGEQKCGTGWLRDRLREHPGIYCHAREVNFFNECRNYSRGIQWYSSILKAGRGAIAIGEKSPDYFWSGRGSKDHFDNPLENIARDLPSARIVLCLRDPVERTISAFHHHLYHRGRRIHPQLVRQHPLEQLLFDDRFEFTRRCGILQRSFYAERLASAQRLFGARLLTLIFEEDIASNPRSGLRRVLGHLGTSPEDQNFRFEENAKARRPSYCELLMGHYAPGLRPLLRHLPLGAPYRVTVDDRLRRRLREYFGIDIAATMRLLGRDSDQWPGAAIT